MENDEHSKGFGCFILHDRILFHCKYFRSTHEMKNKQLNRVDKLKQTLNSNDTPFTTHKIIKIRIDATGRYLIGKII